MSDSEANWEDKAMWLLAKHVHVNTGKWPALPCGTNPVNSYFTTYHHWILICTLSGLKKMDDIQGPLGTVSVIAAALRQRFAVLFLPKHQQEMAMTQPCPSLSLRQAELLAEVWSHFMAFATAYVTFSWSTSSLDIFVLTTRHIYVLAVPALQRFTTCIFEEAIPGATEIVEMARRLDCLDFPNDAKALEIAIKAKSKAKSSDAMPDKGGNAGKVRKCRHCRTRVDDFAKHNLVCPNHPNHRRVKGAAKEGGVK